MSKISLKHSGGNVVSLNSPTSAPTSADVAFKLPNADGNAGQFMKTDGSGNLAFASVATPVSPLFTNYAVINDSKAYNVAGGTFSSGAWRTRDLNTEVFDPDSIVSISSNQFTLQAGTYYIRAQAPAYRVDQHHIKLQNITDSTTDGVGSVGMSSSSFASITLSLLTTRFTISSAKVFEIQHRCSTTHNTYGLGIMHSISGTNSIYTIVEIFKES